MSLKTRLLFAVAFLVAVVIAVLSSVAYFRMETEIVAGARNEIQASVRGNSQALSRWFSQHQDAVTAVAAHLGGVAEPIPFFCRPASKRLVLISYLLVMPINA